MSWLAWAWDFMARVGSLNSVRAWRMHSLAWASAMTERAAMRASSALTGHMAAISAIAAWTLSAISSGSVRSGGGTQA